MKFYFFLCLLKIIISIKENGNCNYESSVSSEKITLSQCRNLVTEAGNQCCVAVISSLGNNNFFCHPFKEGATKEEIEKKLIEDYISPAEKNLPGIFHKIKGSCDSDVEPFENKKCIPEDSQRLNQFGNCTYFDKTSESNYCCLFTGKTFNNRDAYFCNELNEQEAKKMDETVDKIDKKYEMNDIQYLNCIPTKPEPDPIPDDGKKNAGFYLKLKLFVCYIFLILL